MIASDINPVELKVFLNHIYEIKKRSTSDGTLYYQEEV